MGAWIVWPDKFNDRLFVAISITAFYLSQLSNYGRKQNKTVQKTWVSPLNQRKVNTSRLENQGDRTTLILHGARYITGRVISLEDLRPCHITRTVCNQGHLLGLQPRKIANENTAVIYMPHLIHLYSGVPGSNDTIKSPMKDKVQLAIITHIFSFLTFRV